MSKFDMENGLVDYARMFGAVAIIYFHMKLPNGELGLFALCMFSTLAFYFLCNQLPKRSIKTIVISRTKRILVPWIFWSTVFALAKFIDAFVARNPLASEFDLRMLLTGPAIHLWFLPFLFLSSLFVALLWSVIYPTKFDDYLMYSGYICLCFLTSHVSKTTILSVPFAQWFYVLPACAFGVLVAMKPLDLKHVVNLSLIVLVVFCLQLAANYSVGRVQLLIGSAVSLLSLYLYLPRTVVSALMSRAAMGVYLVHPIVVALLLKLDPASKGTALAFTITCLSSIVFALLLSNFKITKSVL